MRTTVALDDDLLAAAQEYTGLTEKSALVNAGLKALVEREASRRLARLGGSEPGLKAAPRRRFKGDLSCGFRSVVVTHPFVIGELLLGDLRKPGTLETLDNLPQVPIASVQEVRFAIGEQKLANTGIGYVDTHLLVSALLTDDCLLLTLDKKLASIARRLAISADAD